MDIDIIIDVLICHPYYFFESLPSPAVTMIFASRRLKLSHKESPDLTMASNADRFIVRFIASMQGRFVRRDSTSSALTRSLRDASAVAIFATPPLRDEPFIRRIAGLRYVRNAGPFGEGVLW